MKRLLYLTLCLSLLAGCSKDKIEEDTPVPPEDVILELSATDLVFESGGGKQEFTISCNTDWTLTNESDWCTTDVTSGNGDKTVTVTVATSAETEDRNLNLSVTAGERTGILTVTEKHGNALIMAKDKFDLPQDGGDVAIDVKSDVEEVIIPDEYKSWITLAPDTRAAQIKCYVFIILEKKGKDGRRGYIIFKSGERSDTVFIFQAPEERLILSEDTCHVSSKGGDLTVELKTKIAYDVTIPPAAASWISRITEHSFRTDRLKLHIEADSIADRSAEIVIKNRYGDEIDTLYIQQTAPQSPKENITAAFDPAFAGLLQRKGYIPDSTRILIEDVQGIDSLNVGGTYEDWKAEKGLTSLAGIEYFESLTKLYCAYNRLTALDVSKNTVLKDLWCFSNKLASLDVSKNLNLSNLSCANNQLTFLNVSNTTALSNLFCDNNQLESLDISQNTLLNYLGCEFNPGNEKGIFSITVWNNYENKLSISRSWNYDGEKVIVRILNDEYGENITSSFDPFFAKILQEKDYIPDATYIVVADVKDIDVLDVGGTQEDYDSGKGLTSLNWIEHFKSLRELYCNFNQLSSLNLSNNTKLTWLWSFSNQLSSLDISKNLILGDLDCRSNHLTTLDVSKNTVLSTLFCSNNQLSSLDVSKNVVLTMLGCYNNHLTTLDVSKNIDLTDLDCSVNKLTSLNIDNNIALINLDCSNNLLTSIDVTKNLALVELSCTSNQLTTVDVSHNIALTALRCGYNQLSSLNLGKNTTLTQIACMVNQLSSLDIRYNTKLKWLYCFENPGDGESLFPVTAWFDNNTIPANMELYFSDTSDGNSWNYDGKTITIDFRKAE